MSKFTLKNGIYKIIKWSDIDKAIDPNSHTFTHGGIFNNDWFSDKLFIALSISIVTSTDKAIVIGCGSSNTSQSISAQSLPPPAHWKWWVYWLSKKKHFYNF